MDISLKEAARRLNGDINGDQILCPGPGHSPKDRSLSVKITSAVKSGFIVHSFANDDPMVCRDYVAEKLELPKFTPAAPAERFSLDMMMRAAMSAAADRKPKGKLIDSYHYTDLAGVLLYEVLRYEPKDFRQRQPDGNGGHIWNLNGIKRVIYRWPEVLEHPSATVLICEGEKDTNNVINLNLTATTVAGGKWTDDCIQALKDRHCWIVQDCDDAGKKKALAAATALNGTAASIKIVALPGLTGEKGNKDVSDWLDQGHTKTELIDACADTPNWEPTETTTTAETADSSTTASTTETKAETDAPLPKSKSLVAFPLVRFGDVTLNVSRDYLIKGLIPRKGLTLIWGPPKCYKSFWAMDVGLHIALGWPYRERKTQQASVVYLALEGSNGYALRVEAFKKHYGVTDAPFYLLRSKINLVKKVDQLLKDIEAQLGNERPGAIFIDTLNRSMPGSESSDEDMSAYLVAAGKIEEHFSCCVAVVHHCGHEGTRPRGHSSLTAAADVQIAAKRPCDMESVATVEYAKDGPEGAEIYSRLKWIETGIDVDGEANGSFVMLAADKDTIRKPAKVTPLNARQINALDALDEATLNHGVEPSFETHSSIRRVTTIDAWKDAMVKNGTIKKYDANPPQTLSRIQDQLKAKKAIGVRHQYVWRATKS